MIELAISFVLVGLSVCSEYLSQKQKLVLLVCLCTFAGFLTAQVIYGIDGV